MNLWNAKHTNTAILYAENCPQIPLILQMTNPQEEAPFEIINSFPGRLKSVKSNMVYRPHIITTGKWHQNIIKGFHEVQHQRQLSILTNKIRNCKSLTQRKKDHNDPIIYPAYFIRQNKRSKDARIDAYYRKVLQGGCKGPSPAHRPTKKVFKSKMYVHENQLEDYHTKESFWENQERIQSFTQSKFPLPPVTPQDSNSRKDKIFLNLPEDNCQSIVSFVLQRRLFLEGDLRILKARLLHNYGKGIEKAWQQALYFILRSKLPQ